MDHNHPHRHHRRLRRVLIVAVVVATGCSDGPSVLEPAGPDAERIVRLWWVMLTVAGLVFAVVLWFLVGSIVRARRAAPDDDMESPGTTGRRLVLWGGLIGPAVILTGVFTLSTLDLRALSAHRPTTVDVTVTGEQWWWRVAYPDEEVVTANEIHVPTGEQIRFTLESADVLHSFWVPEAGPKRDMIPGSTNELVLTFPKPTRNRGVCAEFCGLQHARMQFHIVSQERPAYEAWLERQRRPAPEPTTDSQRRGREVFATSKCIGCHTIEGVADAASIGPDLTHLASRETIAGGVIPLTTENLRSWIEDPDDLKPGALMPPSTMDDEDLDALVAYLESLQ